MTISIANSKAGPGTRIGLSAETALTGERVCAGRTTVITGVLTTESEYSLLPLDAVFVRSLEDFRAVGSFDEQPFLVTESGFPLAAELIELGQLDPKSPITWSLQAPLKETLEQLSLLELPAEIAVHRISGAIEAVVVSTAAVPHAERLDLQSFQAGFAVNATLLGYEYANRPLDHDGSLQELIDLRRKHLSLLEVLLPAADQASDEVAVPTGPSDEVLKLEKELLVLKERFDVLDNDHQAMDTDYRALDAKYQALESDHQALASEYKALTKKYQALANSRLGRLTLRLWQRKTSSSNKMQSKEEA
ncbi:hypothetical protein RI444_16995 [Paenarthrobacter sp. AT5]|uniref:hypothetical protein n=1 Tax=Paenarthrobacter TaxID=1742992 RepID=UPI001A986921|nr:MULTISPECIES: hypothetical protein [Paenarthrobacter]WOC60196.1 hypothetical protein RI444_16995 [Paenarthrobacter sp. AT5]